MMSDELSIDIQLSRTTIAAAQQPQLVYVLLGIQPSAQQATAQLPVNLTLVVDRSQSMCIPILTEEQFEELARGGGAREVVVDGVPVWEFHNAQAGLTARAPRSLDFVKAALRNVVEKLGPYDRFSLVVFAREGCVLIGNESATSRNRLLTAVDQLDGLQLGDETCMARGMVLGYAEATKRMSSETVTRIVLLTDGFAADGEECLRQAQQAAAARVHISTVGLGAEFNEDLLISIADISKGNAYFVHDPQEIAAVFARELNGVQTVAQRNLELKLALTGGVELHKAYRVKPVIADLGTVAIADGSASIQLGDLERDAPPALLLELIVPPRPAGKYRLAQVVLAYDSPAQGLSGQKWRSDIVVQYAESTPVGSSPDSHVISVVERVSAHTLQTRALQDAQAGNVTRATAKLQAARTRLLAMGESELAETTRQEIENLQRAGQVSAAGTKKLRYETRRLTGRTEG
jgi:hypothetical protein